MLDIYRLIGLTHFQEVSPGARALYLTLASSVDEGGRKSIGSDAWMTRWANLPKRDNPSKCLDELEAAGLLTVDRSGELTVVLSHPDLVDRKAAVRAHERRRKAAWRASKAST